MVRKGGKSRVKPALIKETHKFTKKKSIVKTVTSWGVSKFPRHSLEKALRIPTAILEQNAGKGTTEAEAAKFIGITNIKWNFVVEVSSAVKYGLLERPSPGVLKPTELAKRIIRPQVAEDEISGLREAIITAPVISDVYTHYRGYNLPDKVFFENALVDTFKIPKDKISEFIDVFTESLTKARLIEAICEKQRVLDISNDSSSPFIDITAELKRLSKAAAISSTDSCFVMMSFATPLGEYYNKIYEPAIEKTGRKAVRADDDIFRTGKIMDQIRNGINSAKVLIAELTSKNPNVYYELGLAHALKKPVVLVCSNEEEVPFDLRHIRVIYYDVHDPFWWSKLIEKLAENILSAVTNPDEATLYRDWYNIIKSSTVKP